MSGKWSQVCSWVALLYLFTTDKGSYIVWNNVENGIKHHKPNPYIVEFLGYASWTLKHIWKQQRYFYKTDTV
jgi:hypothetical protein